MGTIHAANPAKSDRLKRVLLALIEAGERGLTTRDLIRITEQCAINSIASELRVAGHVVTCDYERTTEQGQRVYRYRLIERAQGELF
jgi:hypothetical protein